MSDLHQLMGKYLEIEVSGGIIHKGTLIDTGLDIIVIQDAFSKSYIYIPAVHIQRSKETIKEDSSAFESPSENPMKLFPNRWTFREVLSNAQSKFVEIFVAGNKSIHGKITCIMDNYIVFHSPLLKTIYISMNHIKWLTPYAEDETPYSLNDQNLTITLSPTIEKTFEELCKKFEDQMVILDCGDHFEKSGFLKKVINSRIYLTTADRKTVCWYLDHIKTIHLP